MLIAVTGGTGFIGRALVNVHVEHGDQVRVLSRRQQESPAFDAIKVYRGELESPVDILAQFVDGVDVLYNCAGEIRDQDKMYDVHVAGTKNLCAAAFGKIGQWVQLSSVGAYGTRVNGMVTEETPLNPIGTYEATKTESDQIVMNASQEGAFTCSILRPSNVYGADMSNQSLFQMIAMIKKGHFFFIGQPGASANYVHVNNVVEALMLCGGAPASRGRAFNLSDHRTMEVFVAVIADELGCPTPKLRLPERPIRWLSRLFELKQGFPLTASRIDAMTTRSVYTIRRIQNELGYAHRITMEEGIRELVRTWKRSG